MEEADASRFAFHMLNARFQIPVPQHFGVKNVIMVKLKVMVMMVRISIEKVEKLLIIVMSAWVDSDGKYDDEEDENDDNDYRG